MAEKSVGEDSFSESIFNSTIKDRVLHLIVPSFKEVVAGFELAGDQKIVESIRDIRSQELFSEIGHDDFNESFINSL
jgi:hypothetical protein